MFCLKPSPTFTNLPVFGEKGHQNLKIKADFWKISTDF